MTLRLLVACCLLPLAGLAQGNVMTLIPPPAPVAAASAVRLDLLAVNPSGRDTAFTAPDRLAARLQAGERSWPVELQAAHPAAATVAAGGFAARTYTVNLPAETSGQLVLELFLPDTDVGPLRAVLDVAAAGPAAPVVEEHATRLSPLRGAVPAIAQVRRSFVNRFAEHDPVYFLYGPDDPAAKFQFSFKYRVFDFSAPADTKRSLQFGYTQRSLWDIDSSSSPFYDTSYMPSLFFESLAPGREDGGLFTWLGWQSGYQHESNGRDLADSRSLNTLFLRSGLAIGPLDRWHLIVSPRLWAYVGGLSDNPRLKDYRGYGEWTVTLGKNDGPSLTYTGRAGRDFNHFTTQLDLTIPLQLKVVDFATFLLIQYFNGYGESLLDYDRHSETVRVGISLIR